MTKVVEKVAQKVVALVKRKAQNWAAQLVERKDEKRVDETAGLTVDSLVASLDFQTVAK